MEINNHVLTVGEFTQDLPRLATAATVTVWQVPTEYQTSGYFVAVDIKGDPATLPACDSKDAVLIGVLELPADESAQLEQAKAERLGTINTECDKALASLTATYPNSEINSWPQQVKEAETFAADPQASVPLLNAIATYRGLTVADLAARVTAKAGAFSEISGAIIGKRQSLEDMLTAAATMDEVAGVAW
jgi:hypothetical protein